MVNAAQVREVLSEYISGNLNSESFLKKFALLSHNIHRCDDVEAVSLCNSVESAMASVQAGIGTREQFKRFLSELATGYTIEVSVADEYRQEFVLPSDEPYDSVYEPSFAVRA